MKEKFQISSEPDLTDAKGRIYALKKWLAQEKVGEAECREAEEIFNSLK